MLIHGMLLICQRFERLFACGKTLLQVQVSLSAGGDILRLKDEAGRKVITVENQRNGERDPNWRSGLGYESALGFRATPIPALNEPPQKIMRRRPVFAVAYVMETQAFQFIRRVAQKAAYRAIDLFKLSGDAYDCHANSGMLKRVVKPLFTLVKRPLQQNLGPDLEPNLKFSRIGWR